MWKKKYVGAPHAPAKGCALCTPAFSDGANVEEEVCGDTPRPGKGLRPLHSCTLIVFVRGVDEMVDLSLLEKRDASGVQAV
jgi:hypothetical protein